MCHEAACPEQGIRRRMESHLEFEVYGLILYLAFLFAKEGFSDWIFVNHFNKNVRLADTSLARSANIISFHRKEMSLQGCSLTALRWNGGYHVSGFIQKVETVVF